MMRKFFMRFSDKLAGMSYGWRHGLTLMKHCSLTGFHTRQFLELQGRRDLESTARKNKGRLSIVFLDLDHFKPINDELGHAIGDLVLKILGFVWKQLALRPDDQLLEPNNLRSALPCRLGGDEIVLFLPGASEAFAVLLAEALRHEVKAMLNKPAIHQWMRVEYPELADLPEGRLEKVLSRVDFSVGTAHWVLGCDLTLEQAIAEADVLMLKRKQSKHSLLGVLQNERI